MRKTSTVYGFNDVVYAKWWGPKSGTAFLNKSREHETWKELISDKDWIDTKGTQ